MWCNGGKRRLREKGTIPNREIALVDGIKC
jgi:hypothetical protein